MALSNYVVNPKNYTIEKTIGNGHFSQVFLVHPNKNSKQKIALKKINTDDEDSNWQKNIVREISIMSTLNHPSIIHLYGFSLPTQSHHTISIYTDYLPNGNLLEVLRKDEKDGDDSKILTPTLKSILVYGIVSGMSYLHKNGILHRDLKPGNIFLDQNYHPIISDFGLSRFEASDIEMTSKLGTPYFMAPELLNDDAKVKNKISNKIDVYAFSITLLSLFTTSYKFDGSQPRSLFQLINEICNGIRYVIPKGTPKYYVKLIQKCWDSDPDVRPSFAKILDELNNSDDFIFDGSNKKQVHEYMKSLNQINDKTKLNKSTESDSDSESKDKIEEEETKEFNFD